MNVGALSTLWQKISHPRCVNLLEVREDAAAVHLVEELVRAVSVRICCEIRT